MIRYAVGTNHGPKENRETCWWKVAAFPNDGPLKDAMMELGKGLVFIPSLLVGNT